MRVVVYVAAMPVPARYRNKFPVVRHDVDRLTVSVIELPWKRIYVAAVHGYVVPLSVIELPENQINIAAVQGYVVPLSVIESPLNKINVAAVHALVLPVTMLVPRFELSHIVVTFCGMYFTLKLFSFGAFVASTMHSVPACPHFVKAQP